MLKLRSRFKLAAAALVMVISTVLLLQFPHNSNAAPLGISLAEVGSGFTKPTDIASTQVAGDHRLFVAEIGGKVKILQPGNPTFLDISDRVLGGKEEGLLGLAFHPDYASNGFFFVYYTNKDGNNQLSRFSRSADPNVADPNSELKLLTIPHTESAILNGGDLNFGPNDGFLYVATGDGSPADDPNNNAQNKDSLLGKILRLDVNNGAYTNPPSNPYVGKAGRDEIWSLGLRHPWRFSFDRSNGDMFIGDVGQSAREEIDYQQATASGEINFGWRCYEGTAVHNTAGCGPLTSYVGPATEYEHVAGNCSSVTGGYVYRGTKYPTMVGNYLFADFCRGTMWSLTPGGIVGWNREVQGQFPQMITTFGEDVDGELYVADITGKVFHIQGQTPQPTVSPSPSPTVSPSPVVTPVPTNPPAGGGGTSVKPPAKTATTQIAANVQPRSELKGGAPPATVLPKTGSAEVVTLGSTALLFALYLVIRRRRVQR